MCDFEFNAKPFLRKCDEKEEPDTGSAGKEVIEIQEGIFTRGTIDGNVTTTPHFPILPQNGISYNLLVSHTQAHNNAYRINFAYRETFIRSRDLLTSLFLVMASNIYLIMDSSSSISRPISRPGNCIKIIVAR